MPSTTKKVRLDLLLVARKLVPSREKGRRMILAGEVYVNNELHTKPGMRVPENALIRLKEKPQFVSRGGEKLAAALDHFNINPEGWICADIGASTGGFTDCLLKAGASKVYAIDVGYGQLAWTLRQDQRVVVMEKTNARHLKTLPAPVNFVTADVSFISIRLLLPAIQRILKHDGQIIILIKPQFEAGKQDVGKGGVVRDADIHKRVILEVIEAVEKEGFHTQGLMPSPITGPAGNIEFLLWAGCQANEKPDIYTIVTRVVKEVHS